MITAQEITDAVHCQSEHEATSAEVTQLLADMVLKSLDIVYLCDEEHAFPQLTYASPNCFPDMSISIQFAADLSIDEVTVDE